MRPSSTVVATRFSADKFARTIQTTSLMLLGMSGEAIARDYKDILPSLIERIDDDAFKSHAASYTQLVASLAIKAPTLLWHQTRVDLPKKDYVLLTPLELALRSGRWETAKLLLTVMLHQLQTERETPAAIESLRTVFTAEQALAISRAPIERDHCISILVSTDHHRRNMLHRFFHPDAMLRPSPETSNALRPLLHSFIVIILDNAKARRLANPLFALNADNHLPVELVIRHGVPFNRLLPRLFLSLMRSSSHDLVAAPLPAVQPRMGTLEEAFIAAGLFNSLQCFYYFASLSTGDADCKIDARAALELYIEYLHKLNGLTPSEERVINHTLEMSYTKNSVQFYSLLLQTMIKLPFCAKTRSQPQGTRLLFVSLLEDVYTKLNALAISSAAEPKTTSIIEEKEITASTPAETQEHRKHHDIGDLINKSLHLTGREKGHILNDPLLREKVMSLIRAEEGLCINFHVLFLLNLLQWCKPLLKTKDEIDEESINRSLNFLYIKFKTSPRSAEEITKQCIFFLTLVLASGAFEHLSKKSSELVLDIDRVSTTHPMQTIVLFYHLAHKMQYKDLIKNLRRKVKSLLNVTQEVVDPTLHNFAHELLVLAFLFLDIKLFRIVVQFYEHNISDESIKALEAMRISFVLSVAELIQPQRTSAYDHPNCEWITVAYPLMKSQITNSEISSRPAAAASSTSMSELTFSAAILKEILTPIFSTPKKSGLIECKGIELISGDSQSIDSLKLVFARHNEKGVVLSTLRRIGEMLHACFKLDCDIQIQLRDQEFVVELSNFRIASDIQKIKIHIRELVAFVTPSHAAPTEKPRVLPTKPTSTLPVEKDPNAERRENARAARKARRAGGVGTGDILSNLAAAAAPAAPASTDNSGSDTASMTGSPATCGASAASPHSSVTSIPEFPPLLVTSSPAKAGASASGAEQSSFPTFLTQPQPARTDSTEITAEEAEAMLTRNELAPDEDLEKIFLDLQIQFTPRGRP